VRFLFRFYPTPIMTVFAGIAEFERDLIRERTKSGRDAARDRGVSFGRPRKLNPEQAKLAQRLISERENPSGKSPKPSMFMRLRYTDSQRWLLNLKRPAILKPVFCSAAPQTR
jgi:hypothetical protein